MKSGKKLLVAERFLLLRDQFSRVEHADFRAVDQPHFQLFHIRETFGRRADSVAEPGRAFRRVAFPVVDDQQHGRGSSARKAPVAAEARIHLSNDVEYVFPVQPVSEILDLDYFVTPEPVVAGKQQHIQVQPVAYLRLISYSFLSDSRFSNDSMTARSTS